MLTQTRYREFLARHSDCNAARGSLTQQLCDRHADATPDAIALLDEAPDGATTIVSFKRLKELSARFANALHARGVRHGDRVVLFLSQTLEMPIAALACWRLGAIAVPVSTVFSGEGLHHRISHSGAMAVVTDRFGCDKLSAMRERLPASLLTWSIDGAPRAAHDFWKDLQAAADTTPHRAGRDSDGAFIIYTSGTTGKAKGVLHSHRGWLASAGGLAMIHGGLGVQGDVAWSPAEWTWIAGFSGILMCFLYAGSPVISWKSPHPFDPDAVFHFLNRRNVRNTLLTPTMLRLMQQVSRPPATTLRSLFCTGESLTPDMFDYLQNTYGLAPGEAYGQTECAPLTVHNAAYMEPKFGSTGLAVPGIEVAILDADGQPVAAGEPGQIACRRTASAVFVEYWGDSQATAEKFRGDWMLTGDEGRRDDHGYVWFAGRNDDIIKSSGYRIGPTEIEACYAGHPLVELVACVGMPDPVRGKAVTVAVKLRSGSVASDALTRDLLDYGRKRLEKHETPRRIEYVDSMPVTVTGKIMRKEVSRLLTERTAVA